MLDASFSRHRENTHSERVSGVTLATGCSRGYKSDGWIYAQRSMGCLLLAVDLTNSVAKSVARTKLLDCRLFVVWLPSVFGVRSDRNRASANVRGRID